MIGSMEGARGACPLVPGVEDIPCGWLEVSMTDSGASSMVILMLGCATDGADPFERSSIMDIQLKG
jgi:hypothetical protein